MAKANSKITESLFKAVKQLTEGGATIPEICDYFHISAATVSRIRAAQTYEEYKHENAVAYLAAKAKREQKPKKPTETENNQTKPTETELNPERVVEHRQTVQITATHYMMEEIKEIKEILKLISNKLAYIVNDLYGTKEGQ